MSYDKVLGSIGPRAQLVRSCYQFLPMDNIFFSATQSTLNLSQIFSCCLQLIKTKYFFIVFTPMSYDKVLGSIGPRAQLVRSCYQFLPMDNIFFSASSTVIDFRYRFMTIGDGFRLMTISID